MSDVQFKLVSVDYDGQPECKRHVVDAYADLARHNMTVTLNMIMQVIGMAPFKESEIGQAFNDDYRTEMIQLDNIQKVNLQKRLYRHFPFFKRMKLENEHTKSVQFKTLLEVMGDFTRCMDKLRDCYTCKVSEGGKEFFELKRRMGKRLQYLYMNTCQLFKSNEMLDHESNKIISALRIPEYDVQMIKPGDKDYRKTYDLYFDKRKKTGLRYNSGTKYFEKSVVKYVLNPDYQAYMMDGKKGMSDIAIIYFLCLFLDKEVSFELMEKVGLTEQVKFTGEHADKQLLYLKELMCMNRIRMIKTRLDSEMTDTALALDMIGEIRKCPKPLYEVFCKEAREEFKDSATVLWEKERGEEAIKTEENRNDDDEVRRAVEKDTPRSTFVRWNDRFPQLALRYIDLTEMFDDIRFQLRLGTYRFAFYNSNIEVDGIERLRILQKELHGFGRIQEVGEEVKKEGMWDKLFDNLNSATL